MSEKNVPILSGTIICQDNGKNVLIPIENLYPYVYEIVILDGGSEDNTVQVIKDFKEKHDKHNKIRLFQNNFQGHFGHQKNLASHKVNSQWIINLDTDEFLGKNTLENLKILCQTDEFDAYGFPRLNTLDGEKTDVWPDYQLRLFRSFCTFIYPTHEELVGWKKKSFLEDNHVIYHHKTSKKQEQQNEMYEELENKWIQFTRADKSEDNENE